MEISVTTTTLDDLDPKIRNVRFLHVDTEGHDIKVLQGGCRFIARQDALPFIQIEFCPLTLRLHGSNISELISFMDEFGYDAYMNCANTLSTLSRFTLTEMFFQWAGTPAMLDLVLMPRPGLRA